MMDGPHGLCVISFNEPKSRRKLVPPFEVHERLRSFDEKSTQDYLFLYVTDQYMGDGRSILVTSMCEHTTEEELTAAKQWLLDMATLRYGGG